MSKKNNGQAAEVTKMPSKTPAVEAKTGNGQGKNHGQNQGKAGGGHSHGPVANFDLDRAKKELEKNRIEFRIENGELVTFDHGDAKARTTATQLVGTFKRKAG